MNKNQNIKKDKIYKSFIVHELEPKKWVFGSSKWTKHNIDFSNLKKSTF